jgi:hypothetical protein
MTKNEYLDNIVCSQESEQSSAELNTKDWWWVPTEDNWRLTWLGYAGFVDLGIESWDFDFNIHKLPPWIYLKLSRHLKVPYYIVDNKKHNKLILFDSKSAVVINLYGDLIKWIRAI